MGLIRFIYVGDDGCECNVTLKVSDPVPAVVSEQEAALYAAVSSSFGENMADAKGRDAWLLEHQQDINTALHSLIGFRMHRQRNPTQETVP